ncbi:MAG: sulfatase [Bryobacterales bacterium]|jgi:N-acetylglucosamine-6-sulfatase|nr:sulfatase [Bryobacterales bacterium]
MNRRNFLLASLAAASARPALSLSQTPRASKPRNVIFILTDDHRYDALGLMKAQPWLQTPQMDRLAREGAHLRNAFVTTALCSPSRASILTGLYAHKHRIVDNNTEIPDGTVFFPAYLRKAGYKTGFFGKWHMGHEGDNPQPGFDEWVSFMGQGTYLPNPNGLNVNGKKVPQKGYITDELTDYALNWLGALPKDQPYFLYLSHKAVHADFVPAERHKGKYQNEKFKFPLTMEKEGEFAQGRPMWVQNQRNSWHGVDYPYHTALDIEEYFKRYAESLLAVDESIGRVLDTLKQRGELDSTLILYMGDNGFAFGEHGLIDKRTAYEESMRVPMLARCPELFPGGRVVDEMVANLDVMPTVLDVAGVPVPEGAHGASMIPLLQGSRPASWRKELLYEYYWERNFPQTPTVHALREDRYKFIRTQGIWDIEELYDLQEDPIEGKNLIFSAAHKDLIQRMRAKLFDILEQTGGMQIPLQRDGGGQGNKRHPNRGEAAPFPPELIGKP